VTPFTDPTSGADDATAGFLAVVSDLTDYLSTDVTLDEIAARVGAWAPGEPGDRQTLVPAELRASSPYVARAGVARFPDSDVAYAVTIVPTDDARPAVAAMRATYGEPRVRAGGPDTPTELQFPPAQSHRGWRIVMLAWALRRGPDLDDAVLTQLLLRRDRVT
jgi:hypothetical protein